MPSRVDDATLRAFLTQTTKSGNIEEVVEESSGLEAAGAAEPMRQRTVEKLAQGIPLSPAERFHLEAIIIPEKRPAIDIVSGDYSTRHQYWLHLNDEPIRARLRGAFASIGRIELPGHPDRPYGGTGFVVGDGLLMTNRHVAEIFAEGLGLTGLRFIAGLGAGIDFLRERRSAAEDFLRVARVVMIHPHWDMALLAVEGTAAARPKLMLSTSIPDAGRQVAVVGYPAFDPRNPSDVQNEVFGGAYGIKRLQPGELRPGAAVASYGHDVDAALHDSSTLGGNSGSCVIDLATGEVVGLHFGGNYGVANYAVPAAELAIDGRVIDAGVAFAGPVERRPTKWDSAWRGVEAAPPQVGTPPAAPTPPVPPAPVPPAPAPAPAGETRIVIPLEITVRLGQAQLGGDAATTAEVSTIERAVAPHHDTDYAARRGYDERFLGVPVPLPVPRRPDELVRLENGGHAIAYHHFSIIMHRRRRLALLGAANVDARPGVKRPGNRPDEDYGRKGLGGLGENDRELWFADPRIGDDEQLPDKFYNKDRKSFDKGHIVRREDVAWGATYEEMRNANGDTFHVTNCSPQVLGFNRSSEGEDNWGDFENHVLAEAGAERLAVFAGPVLADDDPIFSGVDAEGSVAVRIPRRFWKLIVAEKDGRLMSFGFRLEQDLSNVDTEFVVPDRWREFMVSVGEIEDLAGVDVAEAIRAGDQSLTDAGARVRARGGVAASGPRPGADGAPPPVPPVVDIEEILAFWREMQAARRRRKERVRFVVTLGAALSDATIAALVEERLGLKVEVGPLFEPDRDLDRFRAIDVPGVTSDDRADLFDVARAINDLLGSESVEPDLGTHYYDADAAPPPEGSAESADWAFWCWVDETASAPADPDWAINKTKVREAWNASTTAGKPSAGKGIVIYQPDTGVVPEHKELPKDVEKDPRSANFVEGGTSPVDPMSASGNPGHGTSTGSVVASAKAGRMTGSAPAATLVPIRCLTSVAVFNQSPVAQAIDHARRNGAHVITMSLGGVWSSALHAAVKKAVAANVIVVAAAGNCVGQVVWPARFDEVVAVGGINEQFRPWRGSSRGPAVDISGPAELVLRADARDPSDRGKVGPGQGTSFATAHLAGVAACWLAHRGRDSLIAGLAPGTTLQQLFRAAVRQSAVVPPGFDTGQFGAGIVDAEHLMRMVPAPVAGPEAVAAAPRDIAEQVRELLAGVGAGQTEAVAAAPVLADRQNLLEMTCIGLDMARVGRQAPLEALPPLRVSAGLRARLDPAMAGAVFRGGVQ